MNEGAFHAALREKPVDELTWQALADWLDDDGQPQRAELLRLTRRMLQTPVGQRGDLPDRYVELLRAGVRPVIVETVNSLGMRFALVPQGAFLMGSPPDEADRSDDERLHEVTITRPFWLGVFQVTQKQYQTVTGNNPSYFCAGGAGRNVVEGLDTADFPVERVSWQDAQDFLKAMAALPEEKSNRRRYRLPTEAEWEYACRAGTDVKYVFCPDFPSATLISSQANFDGNHAYGSYAKGPYLARTCRVGSYAPNPFGLYDVHGNVWEWCSDWYGSDYYRNSPKKDPQGPANGSGRVDRGGSWYNVGWRCRAAYRFRVAPADPSRDLGFRVAAVAHE